MKRPAIFFDRDNTLIACDDYLGDPAKVQLVPGAAEAVARARALGYATVVISNQSGVARGLFDETAVHNVNQRLDELLTEENPKAIIDRHEFCPYHPEATAEKYRQESDRRKPGPGMIHSAADALALDLSRSWVIGDAPRDIEAGAAAGCRTILFCDPSLAKSPAAVAEQKVQPDYCVTTLKEAMDYIERAAKSGPDEVGQPAAPEPTPAAVAAVQPTVLPSAGPDVVKPVHSSTTTASMHKLESIASEILREIRRNKEQPAEDFSVSKLMAGIVQVLVLAVLLLAYLYRSDARLVAMLLLALVLQTMTIALLIMGRQR